MTVRILPGDCRTVLATLPADSVQCCVTSPPYFGLRDYGVAGQIGLEQTPDEYVDEMVAVFREVRRVLRPDGVCWLNLGDSYSANAGGRPGDTIGLDGYERKGRVHRARSSFRGGAVKPKDLLGIPWMVAFALRADGWWLRSNVIWEKPAPMPESVTDRPTSSHEHVFMLTKRPDYFYDAEAIKESSVSDHPSGNGFKRPASVSRQNADGTPRGNDKQWNDIGGTRNRRNVWRIASSPYPGAHFATMPVALAEECIKAGTSEAGCCPCCGAPWERVIEKGDVDTEAQARCGADRTGGYEGQSTKGHDGAGVQNASDVKRRILAGMRHKRTAAWVPTCSLS